MAARSAHVSSWKQRLREALTLDAQSTTALCERTAVPRPAASRLLNELRTDGIAVKTALPRTSANGLPPAGWRLRESV
jgi:hypothetical protein